MTREQGRAGGASPLTESYALYPRYGSSRLTLQETT